MNGEIAGSSLACFAKPANGPTSPCMESRSCSALVAQWDGPSVADMREHEPWTRGFAMGGESCGLGGVGGGLV
jgi:hypothetical protein